MYVIFTNIETIPYVPLYDFFCLTLWIFKELQVYRQRHLLIYVIKATLVTWREYIGSGEKEAGTEVRNTNP